MDLKQSGKERRERSRAFISGPMRPHASSAFQGAPCRLGSPPASSAFAVLVARYFSPLRNFQTAITPLPRRAHWRAETAPSVSRDRHNHRGDGAGDPAVSRQRADTECNGSEAASTTDCRARVVTCCRHHHQPTCGKDHPEPLHSHVLIHSGLPEARLNCRSFHHH